MSTKATNIHPVLDQIIQKDAKENLLKQRAKVFWMTGLSGSGKSTIAIGVEKELHKKGFLTQILDGDNVRSGINNNLGFSEDDRIENIRRISEVSKLFFNCGIITINSFVSPTIEIRDQARKIIGPENFVEIYINAPLEICEKRDVKGLYKKVRNGEIKNFTGIDAPFEASVNPDIEIRTAELTIEDSIQKVLENILPLIEKK
ncbi:MAG: adenylyl-sulfate kinase [Calditrichaeota bacterium]|nr:MAG: adenylyl-sulfate kinase [Calditrichota bacterium]MBL1206670.1 adenylyl-sulfate kinase [Calditrichota bacterium]NOG46497.1 adenylyl-sulfate kinase [Calditrichota bacterium]